MNKRRDTYTEVTGRIISLLEAGTVPWRQPWTATPMNYVSKRPYRGINVWLTLSQGYASPYWLTYRQAAVVGGHVKRGEKGTMVIFWKFIEKKSNEEDDEVARIPFLRYYTLFNVEQCSGIDVPAKKVEAIASAEVIVEGYKDAPKLEIGSPIASYSPTYDTVYMPVRESFNASEAYYSTLYHEYVHSTGHSKRLGRPGLVDVRYGSQTYSEEELLAEMGSAYLCSLSGMSLVAKTLENSASYIQHWLSKLRADKKFIVHVSSRAQKAVDYIMGSSYDDESSNNTRNTTATNPTHA